MNEKNISLISLIIIIIGLIFFTIFYVEDFKETSILELLKENGNKGKIFGRVDHVISNENSTIFIFTKDQSIKVFYPKKINIKKNDFVWIYATSNEYKNNQELFAHKVIKE